jgi:hypothetical protein
MHRNESCSMIRTKFDGVYIISDEFSLSDHFYALRHCSMLSSFIKIYRTILIPLRH